MFKKDAIITTGAENIYSSFLDDLITRADQLMGEYWRKYPDIYQIVQQKKECVPTSGLEKTPSEPNIEDATTIIAANDTSLLSTTLRGAKLRKRISESNRIIRQHVLEMNADIIPRTQAHNRKCSHQSFKEEQDFRANAVAAQLQSWRSMLPTIIRRFSKIPDYRRATSVKHKISVLMIFGLFAFIFRLSSRREMNRELTTPIIFDHLKKLFPEIDSIPHADTLSRALEHINPRQIKEIHISLIKDLIKKKKFRKMLIQDCVPIAVDGTQKLYRQGLLHDERWCERKVGDAESNEMQQYVYVLEANINLKNGLSIPLMTEYLFRDNNELEQPHCKQDSETTAFERLAERLKKYFPRLKIILLMDAMFATQSTMGILHKNHWEYIIRLPKKKLTDFAKQLNKNKTLRIELPGQQYYRKRKQSFYWENNITYGYEWQLTLSLVACLEEYEIVNKKTGEKEKFYSKHAWISSIPAKADNLHELLNLGARKLGLIENSFDIEKNHGYQYKHAFSYNWIAMQGFHYLMRLGHAINALSEFTKTLKRYIKELGCSATLKLIKETLFSPWLTSEWYTSESLKTAQLCLQLE